MIFATPAQKIDPKEADKKHPILGESIIRVRLVLPGKDVETCGELACPVYVVNEDPEFAQSRWFVDPDEPLTMVLRYDIPATGLSAIPVWVVDDARFMEVQGSETEEDESAGDPAFGAQRCGEDWEGSAERLPAHHGNLGTPTEVYANYERKKGQ